MSDAAARAGAILTVDLQAIVDNWRLLRDRVAPAVCSGVVKADAYGLGAARVAPALYEAGCRFFFVAQLGEAIDLRPRMPAAEIAVLGGVHAGTEADFLAHDALPVLNHLGEIARWQGIARSRGAVLPALVHIDTGMNRLGLGPDELDVLAAEPERLDGIAVRAWMSHLACADEAGSPMNAAQLARFQAALARLPAAPAALANSSGIFRGSAFHFGMVRPGCALYGVNPTPETANPMRPVVRLHGRVLQVRNVDSRMTVGYGATHRIARKGRIATIAVGYADGYLRSLSARGHVFAGGTDSPVVGAPVVGRVSMDLMTADVTGMPESLFHPGALVELIGPHRTVDDVAREAGTIGYEILTNLGSRYHRVYREPAAS